MRIERPFAILCACLLVCGTLAFPLDGSDRLLTKASQLFGAPLNTEHQVFRINDDYVVWLVLDTSGELLEVDVGPRSYYTTEFPKATRTSKGEHLSEAEYEDTLQKISQLKDIGRLEERHGGAFSSQFGPLNTDRFEGAFVDRIVADGDSESVRKFNVYFLRSMEGSPEQVTNLQEQPMVCLVGLWYYLSPQLVRKVKLGEWQTLQVAGPNLHGTTGCFRTTVLHDADGFTIEEPQNESIVISEPYRVRALTGRVSIFDQPLEGVNFEVRRVGSKKVLRSKTGPSGAFSIPRAPDGQYKFKVTKDGFKSLRGTILLDHKAPPGSLSFQLPVGT